MNDLKNDLASLRIADREPPRGRPRRWPIPVILGVIIPAAAWWLTHGRVVTVQTVQPTVTSSSSGRAAGTPLLTASGYVVARRKAVVSAKIQGRLADLKVEEGSRVKDGEVLARLESVDSEAQVVRARAQVQRAEADLAENQRQLRQAESLHRDQILPVDQLEATQSRVKIAEAGVAQAKAELSFSEAQLQNTVIRAPFAGTVVKKMAEVGESVAPIPPGVNLSTSSGAIVALADLETLEVEADVSESNVAKLKDSQPAEVTVEAFPDKRYHAELRQVIPTADRTKATVQVKVTILDKDENLKPEMSAKVTFMEREAPADASVAATAKPLVTVAASAIVNREGGPQVFEVQDGRVRVRKIVTGSTQQGQVVVKEGLRGGETLVATPSDGLKDGDAVKVK
jgi:RND family efflux transporter MFP subunit